MGGLTKVVAGTTAAITAAFATAAVAISKQAVEAYADWEQLSGGVETLFKNSADKVKKYAEDAFFTAGISANEYMETVTSVSASLISSLGGDTEKAADIANMAITDMADNANKMGTPLESIKTAYAGFAKQQYMLLDNLKLGYGGTKTEMQRLLKDAQAYSGVKYDINNLGDVYNAIHAIQEKLGITGTTAKEAEKTITGSANMTKAAWKNVLAAISGGGDLDKAINNLVYSISKYFDNIVPVAQRSLVGIGQLIEKIAPQLVQAVASALIKALPSLLSAVYQMIVGLAKGIYQGIVALFTGSDMTAEVTAQISGVADATGAAADAQQNLADGITEAGKAAKRSLGNFDEINKLSDGDAASGDVSVPSFSGASGTVQIDGKVQDGITPALNALFKKIIEKIRSVGKEMKVVFAPSISSWGDAFSSLGPSIESASSRISTALIKLKDESLAPLGEYILNDFVPPIVNTFNTTVAPIFADVMPVLIDNWTRDFENGCLLIQKYCGILQMAFDGIKKSFSDMCESISEKWNIYGGDLLQGFTNFKNGLWETWWFIYESIIDPVVQACGTSLSWLWDGHLKPLWDNIVEFALSVSDNILVLWNGYLKPVIDWVVTFLAPLATNIISQLVDAVVIAGSIVADVIRGVLTFLDGLLQFIAGVFTLDWERAWGGVVKMFEGLWSTLSDIVKGVNNAVIWAINNLIAAIYSGIAGIVNGLSGIVSSVGNVLGQNWKISMPTKAPQIPYLAQGAVLPPNKPFMAVVGDQRHGTNIEAPLETIKEAVALVMQDQTAAILTGFETSVGVQREILEAVLGIQIGDDVIGNAVTRYNTKQAIIHGGAL